MNVLHESPRSKDVLFLGGDGGAFWSRDGGDHWLPLARGLPTVSILDLAVHPREREVVLATHGRGFYVVDVTTHEQVEPDLLAADVHLFAPGDAILWRNVRGPGGGWDGERNFRAANPAGGAPLWYWLGAGAGAGKPTVEILDAKGKVVRTFEGVEGAGLRSVTWDLRLDAPKAEAAPEGVARPQEPRGSSEPAPRRLYEPGEFAQEASGGRRRRGGRDAPLARPGTYTVRLRIGERTVERELRVVADPAFPVERAD